MNETTCPLCDSPAKHQMSIKCMVATVLCKVCGTYKIAIPLHDGISCNLVDKDDRFLLSGLTRRASEENTKITLTLDNLRSTLESHSVDTDPTERMNRTLLYVGEHQKRADGYVEIDTDKDYPLVFARDSSELMYLLSTLSSMGFLELPPTLTGRLKYRLTPQGWNAVRQLHQTPVDSNQAFVAMWFTCDIKSAYVDGIKPALESTGFMPYRVDLDEFSGKIDDRIIAEIRRSELLVADFTGNRGGVYFEAGFALGLGIPVIWTCRKTDISKVHFDTRQYNHITWEGAEDLKEKLQNRIAAVVPGRIVLR